MLPTLEQTKLLKEHILLFLFGIQWVSELGGHRTPTKYAVSSNSYRKNVNHGYPLKSSNRIPVGVCKLKSLLSGYL